MSKVVFLSNVDRRFAMMQVALQQLQQENLLSNDSVCAKLSDNTVWNDEWQKLLEDADILLLKQDLTPLFSKNCCHLLKNINCDIILTLPVLKRKNW